MTEIIFSSLQERAIAAIIDWYARFLNGEAEQIFYLAGYAGTGKSTIVKEAVERLQDKFNIKEIPMGAYTGKAAFVLRKKGNAQASTIHGMIYTVRENPETGEIEFGLNTLGRAAMADLILLDECSMIDNAMADDLLSFDKPILVMGDPGQLPPINGEGRFTNRKPDFFLDEIHRQAADSPIIELATMARNGINPPLGYRKQGVEVHQLTGATGELIHEKNTQVLCGLNRVRWNATQAIRQRIFGETLYFPQPGEKILCCKNNNKKGLFNGGAGTLKKLQYMNFGDWQEVDYRSGQLSETTRYRIYANIEDMPYEKLNFDSYLFRQHFDNGASKHDWKSRQPNWFDWGYIWSVHKAQGSSFRHVTLVDNSPSFREHRWKHLYTAITRAEEGLIVLSGG